MMVLVDTPVWSLALRRRPEHLSGSQPGLANVLAELIREGRAQMVGPIRQELLSGIREEAQFKKIRDYLRAFREPSLEAEDYEDAARMSSRCRSRGISRIGSRFSHLRRRPPPRFVHSHDRSGFSELRFGVAGTLALGLHHRLSQLAYLIWKAAASSRRRTFYEPALSRYNNSHMESVSS